MDGRVLRSEGTRNLALAAVGEHRKTDSGFRLQERRQPRNDDWKISNDQPAAFCRTGTFQSGRMKWQV